MSRQLPSHPNLEHLRKQAKDLLRDLQQRDPSLKLSDAQHALAREYGFASWPKLKVHVESLSSAVTDNHPFAGRWRANLSKSHRHPGNQFQNAVLEFAVQGNSVTIVDVLVDDSGREVHGKNTIIVDGNEHPSGHDDGYVLIARWRGLRILETLATRDGRAAGWGRYEVSADDNTLTISGEEQVIVLDRDQ
jgi:hypothetical protein